METIYIEMIPSLIYNLPFQISSSKLGKRSNTPEMEAATPQQIDYLHSKALNCVCLLFSHVQSSHFKPILSATFA